MFVQMVFGKSKSALIIDTEFEEYLGNNQWRNFIELYEGKGLPVAPNFLLAMIGDNVYYTYTKQTVSEYFEAILAHPESGPCIKKYETEIRKLMLLL